MLETRIQKLIRQKQLKKEKGASMIEYALVIAGVAVVAYVLFGGAGGGTVGTAIKGAVDGAVGEIQPASSGG